MASLRKITSILAVFLCAGPQLVAAQQDRVLSLEEAVKLALVNNMNLQSTMDSVQGAQISEKLSESRFNLKVVPSFAKGFGQDTTVDQAFGLEAAKLLPFGATVIASMRTDANRALLTEFGDFSTYNNSSILFGVTQPLLRGFGTQSTEFDLENSRRNLQGAERNLRVSRQRLAVEVVASYYNIVRQQGLVDVAQGSLERNKELLRASEARLEVGLASKLDVFRAELQLSQAEEAVINRAEALQLAMDRLKFNLGLAPSESIRLDMVEPEYQPVEVHLDSLTETALRNRIEVREERDRIDDARRAMAVSRQNLLPELNLNLRYEKRGVGTNLRESFNFQDSAMNFFFSTSYALDRSSEHASYARSQIDINARRRSLRLTEYNVVNEVRAASRNVTRIGKSILLQEKNIDFAEKQLRLATLRYQRGLASNFDIIDAENSLIQARSNYVSLLADHLVSKIELKRVTGTLDVDTEFQPGNFLPSARHHP